MLAAAKCGVKPYTAIWCEHHEDLLGERIDGKFDAYQVKTSKPELGSWHMLDSEIVKTIGRFVDLLSAHGSWINDLFVVSNTAFDDVTDASSDERRRARAPRRFLPQVRRCQNPSEIPAPFDGTFAALQAGCACDPNTLFDVIKRVELVSGPSRDDFNAAVAHEHLANVPECKHFSAEELDCLRDEMVNLVALASSLHVVDPIRHLRSVFGGNGPDPVLIAKRIVVAELVFNGHTNGPPPFAFQGEPAITLGGPRPESVRDQKLLKGGIDPDQIEYLAERERAAEAQLIADTHRRPEAYPQLLRQLEAVVLGECREAYLRASRTGEPFGVNMLVDLQDRLRSVAATRDHLVGRHEYECLVGIASMLTGDCRVWWSNRFPLDEGTK